MKKREQVNPLRRQDAPLGWAGTTPWRRLSARYPNIMFAVQRTQQSLHLTQKVWRWFRTTCERIYMHYLVLHLRNRIWHVIRRICTGHSGSEPELGWPGSHRRRHAFDLRRLAQLRDVEPFRLRDSSWHNSSLITLAYIFSASFEHFAYNSVDNVHMLDILQSIETRGWNVSSFQWAFFWGHVQKRFSSFVDR